MVYPLLYMGHRAIPVPYPAAQRSTHSSRTTFGMQMWSTRFGFIWHAFLVATLGANEFTGSKSYNDKASLNLHRPSGLSKDHPKISEDRKYHKGSLGKVRKKKNAKHPQALFFFGRPELVGACGRQFLFPEALGYLHTLGPEPGGKSMNFFRIEKNPTNQKQT